MTSKKTTTQKKKETKKNDSLKKEIEQLKEEIKEKNDKLLRAIAEFENYQKRMKKELKHVEEQTKEKYVSELIDLTELLKKALEDEKPKEGLKLMLNNIERFFEKENIRKIECIGKCFDHNYHHALTTIEKNDCEDNTIIEEIKKGYIIGDKILRPSQVIVAKNKDKKIMR
jgi:molecular chaperone GrpE